MVDTTNTSQLAYKRFPLNENLIYEVEVKSTISIGGVNDNRGGRVCVLEFRRFTSRTRDTVYVVKAGEDRDDSSPDSELRELFKEITSENVKKMFVKYKREYGDA